MKTLSLLLSLIVFCVAAYFFAVDFRLSSESNYIIYMALLVILMSICIVGMMINVPLLLREKKKLHYWLRSQIAKKPIRRLQSIRNKSNFLLHK